MARPTQYQKKREDDPFVSVTAYIPKSLSLRLSMLSKEIGLPMSRLIGFAIDNELDTEKPFNYDCSLPTDDYVEYQYAGEAGKIINFLNLIPSGASIDMLMLCRRDIGIPDKFTFLRAMRELIEKDMVIAGAPSVLSKFNYYKTDHVVYRTPRTEDEAKRFRRIEGESQKGVARNQAKPRKI